MEEIGEWIIKENGGNFEVIYEVYLNIKCVKLMINEVIVKFMDCCCRLEIVLIEKQCVFDIFDNFDKRVVKLDKLFIW